MRFSPVPRTSIIRRAGAGTIAVALALTLAACGSSDKPGATGTTTTRAGTTQDGKETARILARGLQQYVAGNLEDAEKDFKEVISRDPRNKFVFYNLGLIYQNQDKSDDAADQYRLALTIDSEFDSALYNLGILRANDNDIAGAIALYRRALVSNPNFANAHYNLGLLLRGQGETEEGNQEVQTAVKLEPTLRPKAIAEGVPLTGS